MTSVTVVGQVAFLVAPVFSSAAVGWCHAELGSFQEALTCCREALAIYRDLRPRQVRGEAVTLDSLGYAHHHLGNHAEAVACYQQAIDLLGDTGNPADLAEFLTHLGDVHHSAGDHAAARRAWQQGLAILDGLQHPAAGQLRSRLARMIPIAQLPDGST